MTGLVRLPLEVSCGVEADHNLPLFERPDVPEKVLAIFAFDLGSDLRFRVLGL